MKKNNLIYSSVVLVFALFLSLFVLYTPQPNMDDESTFNAKLATEYLAKISADQHSVFDTDNHEIVRQYLIDTLSGFIGNENVTEYNYDKTLFDDDIDYDIHNVLGVVKGDSDTGILLVAHYDSRGHIGRAGELGESYGAADDGYGVATLLEMARLYSHKNLDNSLYILFTDGEETGLYGSHMAAQETALMNKIGLVVNVEARGVKGPTYMFETSTNNNKIIDFYAKADLPVSYSLATAVYTVMPNYTDLTEFFDVHKNGINFAVLNGMKYYHTPYDNYTNINQSSIQHYGSQIVPLVDEFVMHNQYSDPSYFNGDSNQVFFTLFANVFIHYGEGFAQVLHIVLFIAALVFIGYLIAQKQFSFMELVKGLIFVFGAIIVAYLIGNIVARIVAFFSKVPFNMTYIRTMHGDWPTVLTILALIAAFGYLYHTLAQSYQKGIIIAGIILNLLLALVTGFVLSGSSFLFLITGVTGFVLLIMETWCKKAVVKYVMYGILMVLNIIIIVPILFSLYLALTIGGLLALGVILVFYLVSLIPLVQAQVDIE